MVALLDKSLHFPDAHNADEEGLVAMGGDLSTERLLLAYRSGIFPWTAKPITWWSPNPRAILELDHVHIPHRLAKFMRHHPFRVTADRAFDAVIRACATPAPGRKDTWIAPEFIAAYTRLHNLGHAHSVECWRGNELVGGIYGVSVGGLFAGESMFHRADNASKVALCELAAHLRRCGFALFDVQMATQATKQFGVVELPRVEYLARLADAVKLDCTFEPGTLVGES